MIEKMLDKLSKSSFRSAFKLSEKDISFIKTKGFDIIESHAKDLIKKRIVPSVIKNDGKQTPYKNHPVFIAQHATATCCRSCLFKWHKIKKDVELSEEQQNYIVKLIMLWIQKQYNGCERNSYYATRY